MVEAGELIKIRNNFHNTLQEFWVKPFIVEAGELISRSHDTFTDVTKLVESFGLVDSIL